MADSTQNSTEFRTGMQRRYPFYRDRLEPDPLYARLQREEPVCRIQMPYGRPAWLVTTYELAKIVLSDSRFSRAATQGMDSPRENPVDFDQFPDSIVNMDPPNHTRIRQLVSKAFTARSVEQLRPRARQIAAGLIDDMMAAGPPADLVQGFSFALPAIVICELLGIPEADRHEFRRWTDGIVSTSTVGLQEQQEIFLSLLGYFGQLFAKRRERPGADLLSGLVRARDSEDRLTETELLILGITLLVTGYETSAYQITNMVYTVLTQPEQLDTLRAGPELIPDAVEELLRYIALGSAINPRVAKVDVQLGEVLIRAGEPVLTANAAANRDPSVFNRPDELHIARHPNAHLTFGHGPHFCLGAHLARMELQVSVELILSRFPNLRLAVPESDLAWHQGIMRGLTALPLSWDVA
jgi:cytochrome P450